MRRPGRPQSPLDPTDGAVAHLAGQLRAVHEALPDAVTLTNLSKRATYSTAVFSNACGGKTPPTWDVTVAFLKACRREPDIEWWNDWLAARREAKQATGKAPRLPAKLPFPIAEVDRFDGSPGGEDDWTPPWRRAVAWIRPRTGFVLMAVLVVVAAVIVAVSVSGTETSTGPNCDDIGVAHESVDAFRVNRAAWQRAYNAAGGRQALGCPVSDQGQGRVHRWGPGYSQDLADDKGRQTRLMALDADKVFVMTGPLWEDYTHPNLNSAAGTLGYPVSEPITCGNATVVLLDKGSMAPGAMVSTPTNRYVWLPRPIWSRYIELGGPAGPLGRPRNPLNSNNEGSIEFENGTTIELRGDTASVQGFVETTLANTPCPS